MKILCIFMIFVFTFTVSCGPADQHKETKEAIYRKRECYLVRGMCKKVCNNWEYVFNYCESTPCCVVREYIKPPQFNKITTN
ncbi:beta-defensin 113 [Ochotona princeps]|uniref:beta-defensin 113 n=1 Tax=Ochotona princeps TaxID=9978 RepID=UPI001788A475|nr:beta-defensin 113 [Ochotona princeps]